MWLEPPTDDRADAGAATAAARGVEPAAGRSSSDEDPRSRRGVRRRGSELENAPFCGCGSNDGALPGRGDVRRRGVVERGLDPSASSGLLARSIVLRSGDTYGCVGEMVWLERNEPKRKMSAKIMTLLTKVFNRVKDNDTRTE